MRNLKHASLYIFLFGVGIFLGSATAYLENSRIVVLGPGAASNKEKISREAEIANNFSELNTKLKELTKKRHDTWGIVVSDLTKKETLFINEEEIFHGASVLKVLTAVSVLEKVEKGEEDFSRKIEGHSVKELLTSLVNRSDNEAWDTLNVIAGFDNMQNLGKRLGMEKVNVYENKLSPKDVRALLEALYFEKILNETNREFLFSVMQHTETEDRIPAGVEKNVPVIHKTGTYNGTIHDAAIVMAKKPYILVVMGKETNRLEGTSTIQEISKTVFEHFTDIKLL